MPASFATPLLPETRRHYAYCRRLTHKHGPNFSIGFRCLPRPKRLAIYAAYATCRLADDYADEGSPKDAALLEKWEAEVEAAYAGTPSHPVTKALRHSLDTFPIPKAAFLGLIAGCRQDFVKKRYADFGELLGYCELVASTISDISLAVFGSTSAETERLGRRLSTALQLTNVIRDVREDAAKGRIYLPADEMARHGVGEEDVLGGRTTEAMAELLRFQCRRAEGFYREAEALPGHVEADSRLTVDLMARVYRAILAKIARDPLQVFRKRVALNAFDKAVVIGGGLRPLLCRPA
jgi:phytoene synthase